MNTHNWPKSATMSAIDLNPCDSGPCNVSHTGTRLQKAKEHVSLGVGDTLDGSTPSTCQATQPLKIHK